MEEYGALCKHARYRISYAYEAEGTLSKCTFDRQISDSHWLTFYEASGPGRRANAHIYMNYTLVTLAQRLITFAAKKKFSQLYFGHTQTGTHSSITAATHCTLYIVYVYLNCRRRRRNGAMLQSPILFKRQKWKKRRKKNKDIQFHYFLFCPIFFILSISFVM